MVLFIHLHSADMRDGIIHLGACLIKHVFIYVGLSAGKYNKIRNNRFKH
jgi:hypothetical protein